MLMTELLRSSLGIAKVLNLLRLMDFLPKLYFLNRGIIMLPVPKFFKASKRLRNHTARQRSSVPVRSFFDRTDQMIERRPQVMILMGLFALIGVICVGVSISNFQGFHLELSLNRLIIDFQRVIAR
jgi:hypothetical protein